MVGRSEVAYSSKTRQCVFMHHITDKDFRCRTRPAGRRGTRAGAWCPPSCVNSVKTSSLSLSLSPMSHTSSSALVRCNGLCYDTHVKCSLLYQTHYMLNAARHTVFLDPLFLHNAIILHKWWGFDSGQKHRRAPTLGASIHQV